MTTSTDCLLRRLLRRIRLPLWLMFWVVIMGPGSLAVAQPPGEIEQHMRPPSGIEHEPEVWWEDWPTWALAAGVGLLGASLGAGIAMRILQRRAQAAPQELPPHRRALEELARLEASPRAQGQDFETYFTALSTIMRRYLEQRLKLEVTAQTTPEFLQAMRTSTSLRHDQQGLLREFLEQCDLVKFAGVTPTIEQSRALVASARRFIQQTGTG